jgi:hypothetical protein
MYAFRLIVVLPVFHHYPNNREFFTTKTENNAVAKGHYQNFAVPHKQILRGRTLLHIELQTLWEGSARRRS